MMLFLGGIGFQEILVIGLFFIIPFILWFWALIDILKSEFKESTNKIIWVLVVILIPVLGSLFYFSIGRKQKVVAN